MKRQRRGESAEYALSETQVQAVLATCNDLEERVMIGCQLFLGLRVSELVHMRADWITQDGNLKIPLQQACNCAECARLRDGMWRPKTKAGARTLPIPQRLRKDLSELFKVKPYGLDVSRIALYYRTKVILKRAKIKFRGLSGNTGFPHCLRATCASMLASHLQASELCYIMGWKSLNIGEHYIRMATVKPQAIAHTREVFG